MGTQTTDFNYLIPQLFALASKLEGEGQYNNAKLVRSTADSISRRAALDISIPSGDERNRVGRNRSNPFE